MSLVFRRIQEYSAACQPFLPSSVDTRTLGIQSSSATLLLTVFGLFFLGRIPSDWRLTQGGQSSCQLLWNLTADLSGSYVDMDRLGWISVSAVECLPKHDLKLGPRLSDRAIATGFGAYAAQKSALHGELRLRFWSPRVEAHNGRNQTDCETRHCPYANQT